VGGGLGDSSTTSGEQRSDGQAEGQEEGQEEGGDDKAEEGEEGEEGEGGAGEDPGEAPLAKFIRDRDVALGTRVASLGIRARRPPDPNVTGLRAP